MEEKFQKVKQIIANLFNVDEASLTKESSPETIPEWDSMGQLMLIIELEQEFNQPITPEVAESITTLQGILNAIDAHDSQ